MGEVSKPSADIIQLEPRCDQHSHRRVNYVIRYIPDTREWGWSFEYTIVTTYGGTADSIEAAQRAARLHIDLLRGV